MTTVIPGLFQINGVVSTDKSVLQNINAICTAAGCWMTYDITEGKWSVIMNRAGSSIASFNDSNIIGGINVSGKGISELYNSVTIEFPHKDLRDQTDYIDFDIAAGERFPNELDNKLNLSTDLANNPIQAQYIAGAELKQSRVDKVIQFRTDFSMLGLKAGDLIDVTAEMYGYTNKVFRITRLEEDDSEVLELSITALEYDADVYNTADLIRKIRSKKTGITPKAANQTLTRIDNSYTTNQLSNSLNDPANTALITSLLAAFSRNIGGGSGNIVALETITAVRTISEVQTKFNAWVGTLGNNGNPGFADIDKEVWLDFFSSSVIKNMVINVAVPLASYSYRNISNSVQRDGFYAYAPVTTNLAFYSFSNGVLGGRQELQTNTADWQTPNIQILVEDAQPGIYVVEMSPLTTYDLDMDGNFTILPYNYTIVSQASGGGATVTVFAYYR
jgi:hypothetical protein